MYVLDYQCSPTRPACGRTPGHAFFMVHKGAQACISAENFTPRGGKTHDWICRTLVRNARTVRQMFLPGPERFSCFRGAPASRSRFSASGRKPLRRGRTNQLVPRMRLAGGTPARATETVALPISKSFRQGQKDEGGPRSIAVLPPGRPSDHKLPCAATKPP